MIYYSLWDFIQSLKILITIYIKKRGLGFSLWNRFKHEKRRINLHRGLRKGDLHFLYSFSLWMDVNETQQESELC